MFTMSIEKVSVLLMLVVMMSSQGVHANNNTTNATTEMTTDTTMMMANTTEMGNTTMMMMGNTTEMGNTTMMMMGNTTEMGNTTMMMMGNTTEMGNTTMMMMGNTTEMGNTTMMMMANTTEMGNTTMMMMANTTEMMSTTMMMMNCTKYMNETMVNGTNGTMNGTTTGAPMTTICYTMMAKDTTMPPTTAAATTAAAKVTTAGVKTTTKQPADPFLLLDKRIVGLLKALNKAINQTELLRVASNQTVYLGVFDAVVNTTWLANCNLARDYISFLTDLLVINGSQSVVNYTRMDPLFPCKSDCNFVRILSVASEFSRDNSTFAARTFKLLNPTSRALCRGTVFGALIPTPQSANDIVGDPSVASLLSPAQLSALVANDPAGAANIGMAFSSAGIKVDKALAKSIGASISTSVSVTAVFAIASAIPLECMVNASSSELANAFTSGAMDTDNFSPERLSFMVAQMTKSASPTVMASFLRGSPSKKMLASVSTSSLTSISLSVIADIPATALPAAFLKKLGRQFLANASLESITNLDTLSKILPGLTMTDLSAISNENKTATVVRMLEASISKSISPSSLQRANLLAILIAGLKNTTSSTVPATYLAALTATQINSVYILFIEASETIITAFSLLSTWSGLVTNAVGISQASCYEYARYNRGVFAKYAIPALTGNTKLTYANFLELGCCFATVLPTDFFVGMDTADFISYFPTCGEVFQPDSTETTNIQSKLSTHYSGQTNQLFSTVYTELSSLIIYAPTSIITPISFKTDGAAAIANIALVVESSTVEVKSLRFGLTNNGALTIKVSSFKTSFVAAYLANLARRRRRTTTVITCSILSDLTGSLNSLSVANLQSITNAEFTSCQTLLGSFSNAWSSSQLAALVVTAKAVHTNIAAISNTNIASLNAILLGYTSAELQNLVFTQLSSISALGALNTWTTAQMVGLGVASKAYITQAGGVLTSNIVNSINNLACSLSASDVSAMSTTEFGFSVAALSKLSVACPNIASWYALAKANTNYGASLYTDTSAVTELGSIMAGISVADLALTPAESMSSLGASVWSLMPVATVNSMSSAQLAGLTTTQVSDIIDSPNYSSFSSAIQTYATSVAFPTRVTITLSNDAAYLSKLNMASLVTALCFAVTMIRA